MTLADEHVLAAYVDGSDLDSIAPLLKAAFARYAASGSWRSKQVLVVDERQPPDMAEPGFLPDWDLGLNLGLDHIPKIGDWFAGVESLVRLLQQLAADAGREFVIFVCFRSRPWLQEHLTFVGSDPVDLAWLRGAIERLVAH